VDTPVHDRSGLRPGDRLSGPAIVEEPDATVVVPEGWGAFVDAALSLVLDRTSPPPLSAGHGEG
jgi:5-oxoprolinase (ATP-hydrolysing)